TALNQTPNGGAGAQGATGGAQGGANPLGYFVNSLFRSNTSSAGAPGAGQAQPNSSNPEGPGASQAQRNASETAEVVRIFVNAIRTGSLPADDARKAAAYASLWLVVSMLVGAFIASLMATYGGRLRDE